MLEFEKPTIEIKELVESDYFGKFTIEPLERGFGITLGNSLRRVLLSSLPGAAVTDIQIDGVVHEFSTIEGVLEDVTTIILNIKKLVLNMDNDDTQTLLIEAKGEGVVTAADIQCDPSVEVTNKDLHIATLAKDANFRMTMTARRGRGYVRAEFNKQDNQPVGVIPIDSIYTPVQKVSYTVDTRIGKTQTYDRLNLEVQTDGSVNPQEAVATAAKIMMDHLEAVVAINDTAAAWNFMIEKEDSTKTKATEMSIEELDLSVRSYNSLKRAGINSLQELLDFSEEDMMKIRNLGKKSLKEIIDKIHELGLQLRDADRD